MMKLKPCAFCGGSDLRVDDFGITCRSCQAQVLSAGNDSDEDTWNRRAADIATISAALDAKDERIAELERFLFPYANNKEISGVSWDGKYLIGDKASISFFHEMKNRGEQIDVYKRAYDERLAELSGKFDYQYKRACEQEQRAIEAEREHLASLAALDAKDALIAELVEALDPIMDMASAYEDAGPPHETYQSDAWVTKLKKAEAALSKAKAGA